MKPLLLLSFLLTASTAFGQTDTSRLTGSVALRQTDTSGLAAARDSAHAAYVRRYIHQRDLLDLFLLIKKKNPDKRLTAPEGSGPRLHISAAPAVQYSLETGLGLNFTGNAGFHMARDSETNMSAILASVTFTQNQQLLCPLQSSIWTKDNKYNFVSDWRYLEFPENTYGLGGHTLPTDAVSLDYNYLRFYQYVLRKVARDLYVGPGYQLDIHYDIQQLQLKPGQVTPFDVYGYAASSYSSGLALSVLYDTRKNSINPEGERPMGTLSSDRT